jgi:hypothetical protein
VADIAGNVTVRKVSAFIDLTPPETHPSISGAIPKGGGDGFAGSATIDMTYRDNAFTSVIESLSGVAETRYAIVKGFKSAEPKGLDYLVYTAPVVQSQVGDWTVFYYSTDVAGNREQVQWRTFSVKNK